MDIAPWLQAFAAVVQGGAAIVVAVLTHRLVKATREYVSLTHELAKAARAQQDVHAAQAAADYDRLCALVEQLRSKAESLPEKADAATRMLDVVLWTDQELDDVSRLAANQGLALLASGAITHLRWLGDWVRRMKAETSKPPGHDVYWERIRWDEWAHHLGEARTALNRLHGSLMASLAKGTLGNVVEGAGGIEHVSVRPLR